MNIPFNTDLSLTSFLESDAQWCTQLLQEPDIHWGLILMPFPYRIEHFHQWRKMAEEDAEKFGKPITFAIRDGSSKLIGGIGAKQMIPGHKCELGYWLGKPYWGQGIMTDAVAACCRYLQREFDLVRITATVFVGNDSSARVLEKNGFQLEGIQKKHYRKNDRFVDALGYAKVW